jgi:hypothetical protein
MSWCQRTRLFWTIPTKRHNQGKLTIQSQPDEIPQIEFHHARFGSIANRLEDMMKKSPFASKSARLSLVVILFLVAAWIAGLLPIAWPADNPSLAFSGGVVPPAARPASHLQMPAGSGTRFSAATLDTSVCLLAADVSNDGQIDIADAIITSWYWHMSPDQRLAMYDLDHSGMVGVADVQRILSQWGCLIGDVDDDGTITLSDADLVTLFWKGSAGAQGATAYNPRLDINNDGRIDIVDVMIILSRLWRRLHQQSMPTPITTGTPTSAPTATASATPTPMETPTSTSTPTTTPTFTRTPTAMPTSTPTPPLQSFGVHTFDMGNTALTKANSAGVRFVSGTWLSWASVEPTDLDLTHNPTSGNWGLGGAIRDLQSAGFVPIVTLAVAPSWTMPTKSTGCDFASTYLDDFEEFMWAAAERYDGDGDYDGDGSPDGPAEPEVLYWELWNEADFDPTNTVQSYDHGGCWGNRGADYGEMLRRAYRAVTRANPRAKVVFSGIAYDRFTSATAPTGYDPNWYGPFNYHFVRDVFNRLRTSYGSEPGYPFVHVMNLHVYNDFRTYWNGTKPNDQEMLGKVRKLATRLAGLEVPSLPFMVTEVGIASGPSDQWTTRSEDLQAVYVAQTLVRGEVLGLVANQWFSLVDFDHPLGLKYGLLKNDAGLTEKLAYLVYQVTTQQLVGWQYDQQVTWSDNTSIEGHRFKTPDGKKKIVVWADSGYPLGAKSAPTSTPARVRFTSLQFPGVVWTGKLRVTDKLGISSIVPGSSIVIVTVTQSPLFVEVAP